MTFVVSGKRALVTGATGGFGRGFTRALAARGVTVAISARQESALNELADEIAREGHPRPLVLAADLGVAGNAADLAVRAERALGQVDILFNNAGANVVGTQFAVGDDDAARRLFEINYWSPLALIKALVPPMRQRGDGAVLNVTSLAGVAAWVFTGHYSSAKAALSLATDTLRLELKGSGVHVMELMAGPTETALLDGARKTVPGARMGISRSPRGTVEQLSGRLIRGLERRQNVLVYPRILRVTPIFPIPSRWVMNFLQRNLDGDPSRLPKDGQAL